MTLEISGRFDDDLKRAVHNHIWYMNLINGRIPANPSQMYLLKRMKEIKDAYTEKSKCDNAQDAKLA